MTMTTETTTPIDTTVIEPSDAPVIESKDSLEDIAEDDNLPAVPTTEEERSAVQKRINAITKEKYALKARVAELEAKQAATPTELTNLPPAELEKLVLQEATRIATETAFNNRCNTIFQESVAKSPSFAEDIQVLQNIGLTQNKELFDSVVESDNASDILVYLADNLDKAEDLMNLSPRAMIKELTKLELKLASGEVKAKKPVSSAPTPIKPIASRGVAGAIDPAKDPKAWAEQRNKELAAKRRG